ncbi:copper ABC transporter permease [Halosimplex carlsbadense 2-9-1]|uniref:Copper ABC transporter permease n=1 Tax=Halosimplex carlsbadense 2-9-1 TaxID=797114 RepID=M0CXA3_9EURY|nr:ABC transporter permease subunit [Halosimplex carlsbadense]ELZ27866.1 copper ABC transporter permease [Halosimplex carlsbadense 2-9-1]
MSTVTVAKKDFKAARRSKLLWAAAIVLGLIAAFVGYVSGGASGTDTEQVRALFRVLTLLLAVLLPIVALVASYLAIAGEREGGGIKFLLSLPNTRRSVFVGKLLSRNGIVAGGIAFMYVAAISVALTRHGAFPAAVVFGTLLITLVYGSTFVSIALAMSSAAASRSRAIAGAFGTYFVLVILYVFPVVSFGDIARWLHTTLLGAGPNPDLYNAVQYTSPYLAYRKAVNLVMPAEMRQIVFYSSLPEDVSYGSPAANEVLPLYLQDQFSVVVLAFWLVVPLAIGYALFERADLE